MILRHSNLKKYPKVFIKLTGLEVTQFDALVTELLPMFTAAHCRRFDRANRRRAVGGGNHCELQVHDQVLLTVIWLHKYPHQELLGYFFGVSRPTVWRYIKQVSPILDQMPKDGFRMPDPGRNQRRDLGTLLTEIPELVMVIANFERPG